MAKEYIEREAAKKEFSLRFGGVSHAVIANRILDEIPAADVVEVVRCKDCEAWQENPWSKGEMVCKCWADWLPTEPDDFCSCGERRDNE